MIARRRCIVAILALGLQLAVAKGFAAQGLDDPAAVAPAAERDDDFDLELPDGRPLPKLPIRVLGTWDEDELRRVEWQVDLAITDEEFVGKITFPTMPILVPLTVQGTQKGDIVEFSVRFRKSEVAYFAGHVAGTSIVGTFDGVTGQRGQWRGSWIPESLTISEAAE